MLRTSFFAAAITLGVCHPVLAAPSGLLNKTIHISIGMFIPGKSATGATNPIGRTMATTIYVSSAGRIFAKRVSRAKGYGEDKLSAPDNRSGPGGFRFAGNSLVATTTFGNAAGQLTISFDDGFRSCHADLIVGGQNGAPITWVSLGGEKYTQTGRPSISQQSCSIQDGNAFAN